MEITTFADIGKYRLVHQGLLWIGSCTFRYSKYEFNKVSNCNIAPKIEIDILKRSIGKQDHFASTYGNFNKFTFKSDDTVKIKPIPYNKLIKEFENNLLLFYTGIKRDASNILDAQNKNSKKNTEKNRNENLTENLTKILLGSKTIGDFGKYYKNWLLKKNLSKIFHQKKLIIIIILQ